MKIIRIKEVCARLGGISRGTYYNWSEPTSPYYKPGFPRKVRVGAIVGIFDSELDDYIRSLADGQGHRKGEAL